MRITDQAQSQADASDDVGCPASGARPTHLQWIGDLQADFMGIGIRNRGIWIMSSPALVGFAAMLFVPLRTAQPARLDSG
ncbi:hypothetical protein [Stenotrophomonas beteli]|uniref:Uncharacterized protein n=1 Tax=Stenotrophomonas beteli TaxID=3384461 RepID=A0A0R0AUP6_9GAMM|nr:hypothetical protein [Stenotrophomonas maltophilia]KRG48725.1 hypothetical protein ARC23_02560 [Stenotrophomonas maltophilia]